MRLTRVFRQQWLSSEVYGVPFLIHGAVSRIQEQQRVRWPWWDANIVPHGQMALRFLPR